MTDNKYLLRPAHARKGAIALAVLTAMGIAGCAARGGASDTKAQAAPASSTNTASTDAARADAAPGVQTEGGTLQMGQRTPQQDSAFGKATPSAQMDTVAPSPAPRFDENTVLPAPVS